MDANMDPKTTFGLIRHAETVWNREKRIQGQQDTPLTPYGSSSAGLWGRLLLPHNWDCLLCSDLGRARETAVLMNASLKLPLRSDPGLREQDWGEWTGRHLRELQREEADRLVALESTGWHFRPPGGESRREVLARSLQALLGVAADWPGRRILVVCHEGVVKCLIYHLCGRRFLPEEGRLLLRRQLHLVSEKGGRLELDRVNALELEQNNATGRWAQNENTDGS
jgi:probable phosphoglycerate mutase